MNEAPRNIDYYRYETPKIYITWHGITQPFGYFKTAEQANRFINDNILSFNELCCYKIMTPDGYIRPTYDPAPMFNTEQISDEDFYR